MRQIKAHKFDIYLPLTIDNMVIFNLMNLIVVNSKQLITYKQTMLEI